MGFTTFDPGIFNNLPNFQKEIQKRVLCTESQLSPLRYVWIQVAAPFYAILSVAFNALSHLTALFNRKLSLICTVISIQLTRDWDNLCKQWHFGSKLLVPSTYCPQIGTGDVYGLAPHSISSINKTNAVTSLLYQEVAPVDYSTHDLKLEEKIAHYKQWMQFKKTEKEAVLDFFPQEGFSHGGTLLFIYYALFSEEATINDCLIKAAEPFRIGFPKQATILNAFRKGQPEEALLLRKEPRGTISLYELNKAPNKAKEKLNDLEPGAYQLNILNHSLAFIKNEEGTFLFDLNFGLLRMTHEETFEHILKYYHEEENPDAAINIIKYLKQ